MENPWRILRRAKLYCEADNIDVTVECELPAGHRGNHRGSIVWEQHRTLDIITSRLDGGYSAYLQSLYTRRDM